MTDGAFTGGTEHTRRGVLVGSIAIEPADAYLLVHQDKIPGLHARTDLYLYALANPANFCDPSGLLAFLAVLLVAAAVGAAIGAIGATVNEVGAWDEFLLWVVGGTVGGMLAVVAWAGIICGVAALIGGAVAFSAAATAGLNATALTHRATRAGPGGRSCPAVASRSTAPMALDTHQLLHACADTMNTVDHRRRCDDDSEPPWNPPRTRGAPFPTGPRCSSAHLGGYWSRELAGAGRWAEPAAAAALWPWPRPAGDDTPGG